MDKKPPFKNILFTTSTIPMSDSDPVPAFVRDEAIWFKKTHPDIHISVLAPHNAYSHTKKYLKHEHYDEYRFHYFWPFRWEKLAGRGIQPALKANPLLYLQLPNLFVAEFFATWKYMRKLKPDVVYAHWFTPQALTTALAAKITNTPYVFDTQASDAIVLKKVPFARKIVASVCKGAYSYTAPSQQTIDKLLYFFDEQDHEKVLSKLHRIPYGTNIVKAQSATVSSVEKKYGLKNKRVLYFIGRLVDRKGVDILIKAFADLRKSDSSLHLLIVGDGPEKENLIDLAKEHGVLENVTFAGFIAGEERFALLKLATIAVIPSMNVGDQAEGLPVVFMEAISYGKVTVITDQTGAHEFVDNGKNSFVAKAGSVESLKENLDIALKIDNKKLPAFEKEVLKLSEKFQWPSIAKQRAAAFGINSTSASSK